MTRNHKRLHLQQRRGNQRRGLSLLEVSIGTIMAATLMMMAAGVTVDMTRGLADGMSRTRIVGEARLAIESLRRDFSGADPDAAIGDRNRWRLVGVMVPSEDELRLCFDNDLDATADWASPDRVVVYYEQDGQLVRGDIENARTNVIAHHVRGINFERIGNELRIVIDFEFSGRQESFVFNTSIN